VIPARGLPYIRASGLASSDINVRISGERHAVQGRAGWHRGRRWLAGGPLSRYNVHPLLRCAFLFGPDSAKHHHPYAWFHIFEYLFEYRHCDPQYTRSGASTRAVRGRSARHAVYFVA
jgi:hypothetical protein